MYKYKSEKAITQPQTERRLFCVYILDSTVVQCDNIYFWRLKVEKQVIYETVGETGNAGENGRTKENDKIMYRKRSNELRREPDKAKAKYM